MALSDSLLMPIPESLISILRYSVELIASLETSIFTWPCIVYLIAFINKFIVSSLSFARSDTQKIGALLSTINRTDNPFCSARCSINGSRLATHALTSIRSMVSDSCPLSIAAISRILPITPFIYCALEITARCHLSRCSELPEPSSSKCE